MTGIMPLPPMLEGSVFVKKIMDILTGYLTILTFYKKNVRFRVLKWIKTYLWATQRQNRLSNLSLISIEKEILLLFGVGDSFYDLAKEKISARVEKNGFFF